MVSKTLDFKPLPRKHDGLSIYQAFVSILDTFNLKDRILGITLDNASNNNSFIDELELDDTAFYKFHHIRCFANVNNLASQRALEIIKDDFTRLRVGIKKIRSSPQPFFKFSDIQKQMNKDKKPLKPILDEPTRWYSTQLMLERAMKLKDSLITFFTQYDSNLKKVDDVRLSLEAGAWNRIQTLYEYLQPFQEATVTACGYKYPTLSLAVPLYNAILDHVERWMKKTAPENTIVDQLHHACVASYAKMKEYYDCTSNVYTIATVLDPRFKINYYKNKSGVDFDSADDIKAVVEYVYQTKYAPVSSESENTIPKTSHL